MNGMSEETVRCFLGVPLAAADNSLLDSTVDSLRQSAPASIADSVAWVRAANRHLTLAFLGQQPLSELYYLQSVLQARLESWAGFSVAAQSINGFPDARSAIVALELEAAAVLLELVALVEAALTAVLSQPNQTQHGRRYRPHITLGRLKRGKHWQQPSQSVHWSLPVNSVVLFQSRLTPHGAQYSPLWSLPLLPAALSVAQDDAPLQ